MTKACWILLLAVWVVTALVVVRTSGVVVRTAVEGLPSDTVMPSDADQEYPGSGTMIARYR